MSLEAKLLSRYSLVGFICAAVYFEVPVLNFYYILQERSSTSSKRGELGLPYRCGINVIFTIVHICIYIFQLFYFT